MVGPKEPEAKPAGVLGLPQLIDDDGASGPRWAKYLSRSYKA